METLLFASPAVARTVRPPLLAWQAGASVSGPCTCLSLPLAVVPAAAACRSRTRGLKGLAGARGGSLRFRATSEDDSSTSTIGYVAMTPEAGTGTVQETAVVKDDSEAPSSVVEDVPAAERPSSINFFDQLDLQLDSEDTYYVLIYGTGAFVALWISSAIVGAIDSLPLFPKMMEIIGLGFTVWFTYRYLLFKKNRDELFEKIDNLKEQILGSSVD